MPFASVGQRGADEAQVPFERNACSEALRDGRVLRVEGRSLDEIGSPERIGGAPAHGAVQTVLALLSRPADDDPVVGDRYLASKKANVLSSVGSKRLLRQ